MAVFVCVAYKERTDTVVVHNDPSTWPTRHVVRRVGLSRDAVINDLLREGYGHVAKCEPIDALPIWRKRWRAEKKILYKHLARAIGRGTVRPRIAEILGGMFEDTNQRFSRIAQDFLQAISSGVSYYQAMERQSDVFDEYEVSMLQLGDGGKEREQFEMLSKALDVENRVSKKLIEVFTWPIAVIVAALAMVGVFEWNVLPAFVSALASGYPNKTPGQIASTMVFPLPQMYAAGQAMLNPWNDVMVVIAFITIMFALLTAWRLIPSLRYTVNYVGFSIGSFGKVLRLNTEIRILQTFRLLLASNQISMAYEIVRNSAVGEISRQAANNAYQSWRQSHGTWSHHLVHFSEIFRSIHVKRLVAAEEIGSYPALIEEFTEMIDEDESDLNDAVAAFQRELEFWILIAMFVLSLVLTLGLIFPLQSEILQFK